jgi:hydrogenase expression/formation protein HypD
LSALGSDPELQIDAFLCPAHVSAIIGAEAYQPYTGQSGVPCVIAGFEPLDILLGVQGILQQWVDGRAEVDNQYARVVSKKGNERAFALFAKYLEPEDAVWRGIGVIPKSGLKLKKEFSHFDAAVKHNVTIQQGKGAPGCRCGDVVKGIIDPQNCPLFAKRCTPDDPVGPCMVSSEGSCSAAFKYQRC